MATRVIQGFFIGGAFRPRGDAPRPHDRSGNTVQPSRAAPMAQRFGSDGSFIVDPRAIGLAPRGAGTPLPPVLLARMEKAFGADFSRVRVHQGPQAARIGALAFATGDALYFAPGQFQPDTARGRQLIGHELAHVVQQRQGRVRATGSGLAVVQDRALEAEADRLGLRAAAATSPSPAVVQRSAAASAAPSPHAKGVHPGFASLPTIRAVPIAPRIVQHTLSAMVDGNRFSWMTRFSVTATGDKRGAIIQQAGHLFGTGEVAGRNVRHNTVFFEFFPVEADGRSGTDMFASDLTGGPLDYCMLAGKLYYISECHPAFEQVKARFRTHNPAVPAGITMLACADLPAPLLHAIGAPLALRSLFFVRPGGGRQKRLVIRNSSEGVVNDIMDMNA